MTSTRRSIRIALVALVGALTLVAAACGSGGSGPATISIGTLRAAAANSQAADTQTFEMKMAVSAEGQDVTIDASGVMASDGKTGRLKMDMGGLGTIEAIVTPEGYYYDMGSLLGSKMPEGKRWVFISFDEMAEQSGQDLSALRDQSSQDSTKALEYLQSTTGDVEKVGDDTVNGQPATHYVTKLDYAKVAEEKMPNATESQRAKVAKLGVVPLDVWINDQDRVVKMHFDMDGSSLGADGGKVTTTMEITGFGEPLDVTPPPADEVISLSELQGGAGSSTAA